MAARVVHLLVLVPTWTIARQKNSYLKRCRTRNRTLPSAIIRKARPPSTAVMPAIAADKKRQDKEQQKSKQKQLTEALQAVQTDVKSARQEEDILKQFPVFTSYSKGDFTGCVTFKHASQLSEEQKGHMWDIFESNMKDVYTQDNQKWSPKEKRREMFDDDARYFMVTDSQGQLVAYTHFRFEVEENELVEDEMERLKLSRYDPVVYCYELQLHPCVHRKGLGKRLMQMLELVALKFKMHMVMLTVQKSNATAWAFYTKLGYKQHPSCPERNGFADFDECDPGHRILFKDLRRS